MRSPTEVGDLAAALVGTLPIGAEGLFNPWKDHCPFEAPGDGPGMRFQRLAHHLDCEPRVILVGEAPGYQGCRYSGVAFTSERLVIEGAIPRMPMPSGRMSTRRLLFSEPSATIVWKTLYRLGIAEQTILWNALQMHPHKPCEVWTNRTPTGDEIALGEPALRILLAAFPGVPVVAVGRKSADLLAAMGVSLAGTVRHPANGGARLFSDGLEVLLHGKSGWARGG